MSDRPAVAVFRPDDERIDDAVALLDDLGVDPIPDPMLAVEPTDATPREDADVVVLTSKTGAELVADAGWESDDSTVAAIGEPTAAALREAGYTVDVVPETYTSAGLVDALRERVDGARIEVARSDHGSDVLLDGLEDAGGYVHETILYRLVRPESAGRSAELAARGELAGVLFTSSLTVEHFLDAASERDIREETVAGLDDAVVGVIGPPTHETATELGINVDVVPEETTFEALASEAVSLIT